MKHTQPEISERKIVKLIDKYCECFLACYLSLCPARRNMALYGIRRYLKSCKAIDLNLGEASPEQVFREIIVDAKNFKSFALDLDEEAKGVNENNTVSDTFIKFLSGTPTGEGKRRQKMRTNS